MARQRHTFKYDELAKVWHSQSQAEGRSIGRGSMYFVGDTIYSYGSHFPIAMIHAAPNGENIVLMTNRRYSRTTDQRHIPVVASAICKGSRRVVYCHNPKEAAFSHDLNVRNFKLEIEELIAKHAKSRKPELYTSDILYQAHLTRDYCEVLCLPVPEWAMLPELGSGFVEIDKLFNGEPLRALLKVQEAML